MISYITKRQLTFFIGVVLALLGTLIYILFLKMNVSKQLLIFSAILIVVPALLAITLLKKFTKKAIFIPNDEELKVEYYGNESNVDTFLLKNIKSYMIDFPNRRFAVLRLKFKNGKSKEFSFWIERQKADQMDTNELVEKLHQYLASYNNGEIEIKPAFMGTTGGLIVIITLLISVVLVFALYLHNAANVKRVPTSIISVGIILQLIAQRIGDISFYKKMKAKVNR